MHAYSAHLGNASISNTTTPILSKTGTGSPYYMVTGKLNVPYGGNQKQVTCNLRQNGAIIDTADQVFVPGSNTQIAKHTITLQNNVGPVDPASNQTFTVDCQTSDGTTRTVTNITLTVLGVDTLN